MKMYYLIFVAVVYLLSGCVNAYYFGEAKVESKENAVGVTKEDEDNIVRITKMVAKAHGFVVGHPFSFTDAWGRCICRYVLNPRTESGLETGDIVIVAGTRYSESGLSVDINSIGSHGDASRIAHEVDAELKHRLGADRVIFAEREISNPI